LNPQETIIDISSAYWKSQALFTARRLGVFQALGRGCLSVKDCAQRLGATADGLERLLICLSALGLLIQTEKGFSIAEAFRPYLIPGGAKDLSPSVAHMDSLRGNWSRLDEAVRTGRSVVSDEGLSESRKEETTEEFMEAMEGFASVLADPLLSLFPLKGDEEILDLGCGPGTFVRHFLHCYEGVRVTVVDMEDVIPIVRRHVEIEGGLDRVTFINGDLRDVPLNKGHFDLVLLSNVMHIYGKVEVMKILARTVSALRSGGTLLVNDFFTDESGTNPLWGALFSLNMLIHTEGGRNYRLEDGKSFLTEAGFTGVEAWPLSSFATLLIGIKP
jgi:ubiquinone/menaquinone biosynthesis C-methylase UbiE